MMRQRCRLLRLVCALLALPAAAAAAAETGVLAEYSITNWADDAGPFPFGVYAIAQDHEGYLWLGARSGLIRFDGSVFKKWSGSTPLPDDRVSAICVSRDGSMWLGFGTFGGVTRIRNGEVTNFTPRDGLPPGDVNALIEDADGVIWAATYGGLAKFAHDRWERVGDELGLPTKTVYTVLKDSRGSFWVGTSLGIYHRGPQDVRFEFVSSDIVTGLAEDSGGTIWRSDREKGFAVLLRGSATSAGASRSVVGGRMIHDAAGSIWVSTGGGVLRIPHAAASVDHPKIQQLTRRDGLPTNEIRCVFEDRHGTVWIGTRMGLTRLQQTNVRGVLTDEDALVTSVESGRDGSIWVGTSRGLRRRSGGREVMFGKEDGLPSPVISALHRDAAGTLWAATSQGIARFDGRRFEALPSSHHVPLGSVRSIVTDSSGALWVCDQQRGLFRWKNGEWAELGKTFTSEGGAHVAYADAHDRVWVGLWTTGVVVYDHERTSFYTVADGLPPGTVNAILQDRDGAVWIGTTGGLARFANGRFTSYTKYGFPDVGVSSIIEDEQGYFWFGMRAGLLRISPAEFASVATNPTARLRYAIYGTDEGVPGTPNRPGAPNATRQMNGSLWFVTSAGLANVDPSKLHELPVPAPVRIEDVVADGTTLSVSSPLQLRPRTSRIQINYSILSLAAVGKLRFRYKLEHFDSEWQDADDRKQASYTNLPPGEYVFRVVSSNSMGDWNEAGDTLSFAILPAFYQTKVFAVGVVLSIALVIWMVWLLHLRSVKRRFHLVLAERMRMGREIHDTLLQSLVGVALEFDDIWEQLDPSAVALRSQVERIRHQVEHYAREARRSIWNLRSPMLENSDLSEALRQFGEAAVAGTEIEVSVDVHGIQRRASPRLEQELLRVGQEALSNAVRHAHASKIAVRLMYSADAIRLQIKDDGQGFDLSRIARDNTGHWGVTSMKERAKNVGARFNINTSPGRGTSIEMIANWTPLAEDR